MRNQEPTPNNLPALPVISGETLEAVIGQFADGKAGDSQTWGDVLTKLQHELLDTNPNMVKFMETQVGVLPKELHTPVFAAILGTFALIEKQAEADAMSVAFSDTAEEPFDVAEAKRVLADINDPDQEAVEKRAKQRIDDAIKGGTDADTADQRVAREVLRHLRDSDEEDNSQT